MSSSRYRMTVAAEKDLEEIYDYTSDKFGSSQAAKYLEELESLFHQIAENPNIGKTRDETKKGLRSFPKSSHLIFYRVLPDYIRIVRILHGSRDTFHLLD